jgi:hypothetical protein
MAMAKKRMKMIEEKWNKENRRGKNKVIITGIGWIRGNMERRVEEWLERDIGVKVNALRKHLK